MEETKGIIKQLEKIAEEICTEYCKYPNMFAPEDWESGKQEEICGNCPLMRL